MNLLFSILGFLGTVALVVWILAGWWKRSEDRPSLLVRWGFTLGVLLFLAFMVGPLVARMDYAAAFIGIPLAGVGGVMLATIWADPITGWFGRKIGQLFDGGDVPVTPEPVLSIAEARRKAGKPHEAIAELERQLERFPTHVRPLLLLAEIQAEDLRDLPAATATVERFLAQPDHAPKNLAYLLNRLADWQLKLDHNPAQAQQTLERIVQRFPDSTEAYHAHQRIARLASSADVAAASARPTLELPRTDGRLGLRLSATSASPPPPDPLARAETLVQQLQAYPHDSQTREELAVLYATELHRLDLAAQQLEELINQPNAPAPHVARWLNLLADLHVRHGPDLEPARAALQRLIARFPNTALAENARRRLATLALETRSLSGSRVVPMPGSLPHPSAGSPPAPAE